MIKLLFGVFAFCLTGAAFAIIWMIVMIGVIVGLLQ